MSFLHHVKQKFYPTLAEKLGYSNRDILVIVNIDDIGIHKDEMEASFKTIDFGMVKSGSIMVPCPCFERVIKMWNKNPDCNLGVHFTLTCEWGKKYPWTPVLPKTLVPSLYNPQGIMWRSKLELFQHAKKEHINLELDAQIRKILKAGLKPSHLDHHMDFYYRPDLFSEVMKLSRKYNLPMRVWHRRRFKYPVLKNNLVSLRRKRFVFPDTQMGIYSLPGQNQSFKFRKKLYYEYLRSLKPGVHNIKIHIAFQTQELINIMGQRSASIRQIDYDVWTSNETKVLARELGIIFIGFRPLQQLQRKLKA